MDQLLGCGKNRPVTFQTCDMHIPSPIKKEDYLFADFSSQRCTMSQRFVGNKILLLLQPIDNEFAVILQGVAIWAELSRWVAKGTRRASHGLEDCPWLPTSSCGKMNHELEHWRFGNTRKIKLTKLDLSFVEGLLICLLNK
jgi:hypothetical protein